VRDTPDVPELQEDDAALGMNRIGDFAPSSNLLARIDARRSGIPSSGLNDRRCFGDNQAALCGALLVVFEVQRMRRVILLRGSHPGQRSHDDAVAELIRPDFQGRKKRRGHHASSGVCIKGFDALSQLACSWQTYAPMTRPPSKLRIRSPEANFLLSRRCVVFHTRFHSGIASILIQGHRRPKDGQGNTRHDTRHEEQHL